MSRSQSYRSRIPTHIIQLLDVASRITLFLVGQTGPLSFTFKDRLDNKYKTSIGPELHCSCSPQRNDHCIHTIYILLKIFKVSVENPIIWQAAYVDSQLSDLVSGKYTVAQARRLRPTFEIFSEQSTSQLPSEYYRRRQTKQLKPIISSERMLLNDDSVCPICQEDMKEDTCLTFCKVKCGNNFHLQCLKVWAKHRSQQDANINCPMCRSKFPDNFLRQLQNEENQFVKNQSEKIKIEFNCASCGIKNIPTNPHKCLLCTSFQLCEPCYANKKHIKHPFIRKDNDGRWRGAEQRRQSELKIKNYIDGKRKQSFNDQILKKLRKIEQDPNKLIDYVASSYPYVSKYISQHIDPLKNLDFNPSEIRCFKCGATKMIFLRRLTCGHFVDHQCLKDYIIKDKFYCQQDGSQFLKGYQNLKQREKQIEHKKNHHMLNIASEFDVAHIERPKLNQDYNFVSSEEPTLTQILSARRQSPSLHDHNQLRNRIVGNIIRETRSNSRQAERVRQPQYPPIPRPQIRIRNVGASIKPRIPQDRSSKSKAPRQKSERKTKKRNMDEIIETLIGRKLK